MYAIAGGQWPPPPPPLPAAPPPPPPPLHMHAMQQPPPPYAYYYDNNNNYYYYYYYYNTYPDWNPYYPNLNPNPRFHPNLNRRRNMNSRKPGSCTTLGRVQKSKRVVMDPLKEECSAIGGVANFSLAEAEGVNVPDSLMHFEILPRLPVESLLRFRCVCKLWNSLIREKKFRDRHMQLRVIRCNNENATANLSTIILNCDEKNQLVVHYYNTGEDYHIQFDLISSFKKRNKFCKISNSCHGLICIYSENSIHLVNPSMNEAVALPVQGLMRYPYRLALMYDVSIKKYKVVRFYSREISQKIGCRILTLGGSSQTWRDVGDAPIDSVSCSSVNGRTIYLATNNYRSPPKAISFDIQSETFSTEAEVVGGCFCFYYHRMNSKKKTDGKYKYLHLWILEDCKNNRWKEHSIDLDQLEDISVMSSGTVRPLAMLQDGKILISDFNGRFDWYDLENGMFVGKPLNYLTPGDAVLYSESLVSPRAIQGINQ